MPPIFIIAELAALLLLEMAILLIFIIVELAALLWLEMAILQNRPTAKAIITKGKHAKISVNGQQAESIILIAISHK